MSYTPQIDDYVKWEHNNLIDEGWVYFICPDYITIEILAKCKNDENVKDCPLHKKIHVLVLCHRWYWHELEYITHRRDDEPTSHNKIPQRY